MDTKQVIIKQEADKIRKQLKGGMLYGEKIEEFGEDGFLLAAWLYYSAGLFPLENHTVKIDG